MLVAPTGLQSLLLTKKDAMSYLVKRQGDGQNIICECCYNQCTLTEMLQYCASFGSVGR